MIISDETDTHTTIQRLCERIHQLEAVRSIIICSGTGVVYFVFHCHDCLLNVVAPCKQLQKFLVLNITEPVVMDHENVLSLVNCRRTSSLVVVRIRTSKCCAKN